MAKKTKKYNQRTALILIICLIIGVGLALIYFLMYPVKQTSTMTGNNTSEKNIELYEKAADNHDAAICDQIKDGINATNNNDSSKDKNYGFTVAKSIEYKEMNEEEAKASCRENVQKGN